MKKYKLKISILFVLGMLLSTSCNNWLEILPENEQASDEYWTSKEEVEAVLSSGYIKLRNLIPTLIELGELRGGCIYDRSSTSNDLQTFQLTAENKISDWGNFYGVINMANAVIKHAQDVQGIDDTYAEPVMKSHLVEAYFLRSLTYFYIVRNWRNAPLILTPYENDETSYLIPASSEQKIIAQIKSDINKAIATGAAKIRYEEDWETKGRATVWSLNALMADVCLWSEDYSDAIIHCNNILNSNSTFRPEFISTSTKWYEIYFPGNSNESIFEIQYDNRSQQTNNLASWLFGNNSPKYEFTSKLLRDFIDETSITGIDEAVRTLYGSFVTNKDGDNYVNATSGYIWKYSGNGILDQTRSDSEQDPNFIIYRIAEVMLMKAEAMILNSNSEESWNTAINLINKIRTRSNLNPIDVTVSEASEKDMLQYVLNERKMELSAEGKRWYDVLRLGKIKNFAYRDEFLINEVMNYNESANPAWIRSVLSDDHALYLPIYKDELETNKLLEQNPYYDITE